MSFSWSWSSNSCKSRPGQKVTYYTTSNTCGQTTYSNAQQVTSSCNNQVQPSSSSASISNEDFVKNCVKAHNKYRAKHGVAPLKLSQNLCNISQQWANRIASRGVLEHSNSGGQYSENIYWVGSTDPNYKLTGNEAVDSWYSEINKHTFGYEPRDLSSGHFTQVVWKTTKEVGAAFTRGANGIYVVASYSPPGNYVGQFSANVPRLLQNYTEPPSDDDEEKETEKKTEAIEETTNTEEKTETKPKEVPVATDFETECLNAHNEYRRRHGVPDLKLNRDICRFSEEWARIIASRNCLSHRQPNKYGENCAMHWDASISGKVAVDMWYSEIKDHVYGREQFSMVTGHFTQVVWRDSVEMGVGKARSADGKIYIVANYNPPGNYAGRFTANVPRLRR